MTRRDIWDDAGRQVTGATFGVEPRGRALTIRFDSRGTTEGTRAYRAGLVTLLTRLARLGVEISDVVVDSLTVKSLSRAERRLKLAGGKRYPIVVKDEDVESLRRSFHTAAAKVGRPKGAKGGGNGTKKLRLYLGTTKGMDATKLEDAIAGKRAGDN